MDNPSHNPQQPLTVVGSGVSGSDNSRLARLSWRNPLVLVVVLIVVVLGVYLILSSSADSVDYSKVWSTAADWNAGTLSGTAVSGNDVVLSSKTSTSTTPSPSSTTNLALNQPARASSTKSGSPNNVTDGNTSTSWTSAAKSGQYIYVDLGKSYNISNVKLTWANANARTYVIQVSPDANHWTTIYNTSNGDGGVANITGLNGTGRYVSIYVNKTIPSNSSISLDEVAVYASGSSTTTTNTTTYSTSGTVTLNYDAGDSVTWTSLTGSTTLPSGTSVTYEVRTSSDDSTWSGWTNLPSSGSLSSIAASRYIQVEASLATTNTSVTPTLTQLVLDYSVPVASPTATLSSSSTQITAGQTTTLSWSSTNATSCTATGAWSGSEATSGTLTLSPTATSTYDLSCSDGNTTVSASPVTVTVTPATTTTTTSSTSGCTYSGTVAPCIGSATTGASGWGTPVFDDEFNGTSLDTTKWSTSWFNGGSMNDVATSPSNVSVSGGDLILTLSSSSTGALVDTNPNGGAKTGFQFGDGYFVEGRVYFPGSSTTTYNWPAIWTDGQSWPADGEIDIAEGYDGQLSSSYHVGCAGDTSTDCPNNGPNEGTSWAAGFHTYGVDRENGENYIYWDGQLIRSYPTSDGGAPEYIIINVGCISNCTTGTASQVKVDYVRAWQKS